MQQLQSKSKSKAKVKVRAKPRMRRMALGSGWSKTQWRKVERKMLREYQMRKLLQKMTFRQL